MPILNISDVTSSLVKLLEQAFLLSPAWVKAYQPVIIPELPTDQMDLGFDVVGIYLYHTLEKKEYGNFPLPGKDLPTARHLPMALTLYYQLSARHYSDVPDGKNAYDEQLLMSIAMKALHDYPLLDDGSTINSIKIFQGDLPDNHNRLKIFQQPVGSNEAVHNWTAGPAPMRWSAYYEIATIFLEPEEISSYTGRVLAYGNYVFTMGAPRITLSQNIIPYLIPGDPVIREVKVQPAQAPPSGPGILPASVVSFFGSGFTGDGLVVRLYHSRWTVFVIAAPAWNIGVQTDRLIITIRETALEEISGVVADVLPGLYAVEIVVKRNLEMPGGQIRVVSNSSNKFPVIISPRIDAVSLPVAGIVTINGYTFRHIVGVTDILEELIEIYVGETKLTRNKVALFKPGEFRVTAANTVQVNLPNPAPGQQLPLRIIIDGAESAPRWIVT